MTLMMMTSAASLSGRRRYVAPKFRSESFRRRLVLVLVLAVLLLCVLYHRLFPSLGGKDTPGEISTERKIAVLRTLATSLVNPDLLSTRNYLLNPSPDGCKAK